MTDYSLHARVDCSDGHAGEVTATILDPGTRRITHLVIRPGMFAESERLVPIEYVSAASPDSIRLRCTRDELWNMELFVDTHYPPPETTDEELAPTLFSPYYPMHSDVLPFDSSHYPVETEHIPRGELAVRRGAHVRARDGDVGKVEEFLVAPSTGAITHLVIKTGHFYHHKKLALPVTAIEKMTEEEVVLNIDKHAVKALPEAPANRASIK